MDHQFLEGYNQLHYGDEGSSDADQELRVLYQITGEEPELLVDVDRAWEEFEEQLTPVRSISQPSALRSLLRVAAILVIGGCLGIASYFYLETPVGEAQLVTIENASEVLSSHQLPDGSTLWLRQGAIASYTEAFENRTIAFDGEGYFEVQKGQGKFTVTTDDGLQIVVLGTEFGVNTNSDNTIVRVTEGTVSLSSGDSQQRITAGETGVHYSAKRKILKSSEDQTNALSWKTGHFKFSDTSLQEAINFLESFYPATIVIKDATLKNCRINGEFQDRSLQDILEDLSFVLSIEVKRVDNSFVLSGDGC